MINTKLQDSIQPRSPSLQVTDKQQNNVQTGYYSVAMAGSGHVRLTTSYQLSVLYSFAVVTWHTHIVFGISDGPEYFCWLSAHDKTNYLNMYISVL